MTFTDSAKITVKAGDGGKGCESYFRRTDKKMVPNGGDGGAGGDVIFKADRNVSSLRDYAFRNFFEAEKGGQGSSNQKTGRKGNDLVLKVPCGTAIYQLANRFLIRDLTEHDDQVIAVKGGSGGAGNDHGRQARDGKEGEELAVVLDYNLVSDIFLVGTPNSGKSSLLRAITGAKVKSESYPFSTRAPQLGTYQSETYDQVILAELPSLERGSWQGKGLGNQFLKHLKRAKLIFFVLDPVSEFASGLAEAKEILEDEVGHFEASFNSIPRFYIIHKSDLEVSEVKSKKKTFGVYTFHVSSSSGEGVDNLMKQALRFLREVSSKTKFEV